MTARARCGLAKIRKCGGLLFGRFPSKLKEAKYTSYVRPAILQGSEAWCLKESELRILRRTERSMVRAMCGLQLKDRKRSKDFMLILNETINQLEQKISGKMTFADQSGVLASIRLLLG